MKVSIFKNTADKAAGELFGIVRYGVTDGTFEWQPGNLATLFHKPLTRGQEK